MNPSKLQQAVDIALAALQDEIAVEIHTLSYAASRGNAPFVLEAADRLVRAALTLNDLAVAVAEGYRGAH